MIHYEPKFGISVYKYGKDMWAFSIGLNHCMDETYLSIQIFRWHISIGQISKS
ncbi:MAG: hypothetical protein RR585_01820 [Coprobacillus sp.]